jgi:phospholipid/cholesterol/gamma-HCH transport system substrate-binding protein
MGQSFVSLDFGTSAGIPLTDGQDLKTEEQADIGAIMQELHGVAKGVQDVTKAFAGESMNNLFATLSDFMKRNADDLSLSISNMTWASSQIREGKGTIGRLVADDALYTSATNTVISLQNTISNLQSTADEIKATFAEGRKVIDGMNSGEGSVGKLLKDEKLYNEGTAAMTNLKEILEKMNSGQGTVGKLINDQEFYRNAKLTLQKIDKATEELEDSGPLSVLNAVIGKLF